MIRAVAESLIGVAGSGLWTLSHSQSSSVSSGDSHSTGNPGGSGSRVPVSLLSVNAVSLSERSIQFDRCLSVRGYWIERKSPRQRGLFLCDCGYLARVRHDIDQLLHGRGGVPERFSFRRVQIEFDHFFDAARAEFDRHANE